MGTLLPNSFQHPNVYVDRLSYYLTPAEEKVLNKAIREIYGWQDKIASRRARISLSVFTEGKKSEDGTVLCYGCGLSTQSVRDALVGLDEFGILRKVGSPTVYGQMFEIQDDENCIDWDGLAARKDTADERGRSAAARAREGKEKPDEQQEVLEPNTPVSAYDPPVLAPNTPDLLADSNKETQETQLETHTARVTPDAPPGERKRRKTAVKSKTKDPPHKAIVVFRSNTNYYPPKSWYADIMQTVGTEPANLEFWGTVIKQWVGLGWKPTNVAGMLDHYRRRELPGNNYGNGKSPPAQSTVKGI